MRPLIAIALVLAAACGRGDRRGAHDAPSATRTNTPDALVLRVPRAGGTARVLSYPRLDSVVWSSSDALPALDRVLAFDEDAGVIAALDSRGRPIRIDLRTGSVSRLASTPLESPASANADAVFGIEASGLVVRHTPAGDWSFKPPHAAEGAFPQADGTLLVLAVHDDRAVVWRLRPPETRISDSVVLPAVHGALAAQGNDRLYFATDDGLAALRARTLELRTIEVDADSLRALVTTPSGDRIFLLGGERGDRLSVIDRYRDAVEREIALPGPAGALRMDPLGRYLLVGSEARDSVWVVAIGTGRVLGGARSAWRSDLPLVAVDGAVGLVQGPDVAWVDAESLRQIGIAKGGASDFWFAFRWSGFRPRDPRLDQPVTFADSDSAAASVDTTRRTTDSARAPSADTVRAPAAPVWTVSFAALLSESRARELAKSIQVDGLTARVVPTQREGVAVYRVVLGPYVSREEAERVGRESRQANYVVYEGGP